MTCFKVSRSWHDHQLPLTVGPKSSTTQLLDSRGKLWCIANYVVCDDGNDPAKSRKELCMEYLECFRDKINTFNLNTVADGQEVTWAHYLEFIWLHAACQTVRTYRPALQAMFDSRDNRDYPAFNWEFDSVDVTSMFLPQSLGPGEQAFLTAKNPWIVLLAMAEDTAGMTGLSPTFPMREIYVSQLVWGMPNQHVSRNTGSSEFNTQRKAQLYASSATNSPAPSVPEVASPGHQKQECSTPERGQHTETSSGPDAPDPGMEQLQRREAEKNEQYAQIALASPHVEAMPDTFPSATNPHIPENMNCALQLKFPQHATNKDVIDTIRTGAICSYHRSAAPEPYTSLVGLVFMTGSGAEEYMNQIQSNVGIHLHNKRVIASWSEVRVGPCTQQNVSRVLKVTAPVKGNDLNKLIRFVKTCCWVDIVRKWERVKDDGEKSVREMVIEFAGYRGQAETVARVMMEKKGKMGWRVEFLRDPCEGETAEGN